MLITFQNIEKKYGDKDILKASNLIIEDDDKIGLIGINGSGKTSILKAISGIDYFNNGEIIKGKNVKIGYLDQNPDYNQNHTIVQHVESFDNENIENYQYKSILNKLGITNLEEKVKNLSGGELKRLQLALVLVSKYDLLILDEPTNHLDTKMILWLENYLKKLKCAILMVTHDRFFLTNICDKIIDLENKELNTYPGNYEKYLELKTQKQEDEVATRRKKQSLFKQELAWMQQGVRARGTKSKERQNKFHQLAQDLTTEKTMHLQISSATTRLGNETINLKDIEYSYPSKDIFSAFSYQFQQNDRIGITGDNGVGKSTLLNIITKKIEPIEGRVTHGQTIKIGYFAQETIKMDESLTVINYIQTYFANHLEHNKQVISSSTMLEYFLFDKTLQSTKIEKLSGGERRRLYLAIVLMEAPNILILDEPTNDLDIETITILEEFLLNFQGIVIMISHDRYFIKKVVNKFLIIEDKKITVSNDDEPFYNNKDKQVKVKSNEKKAENKNSKLKFSYNEKREFEIIDDEIEKLEQNLVEIDREISENYQDFEYVKKASEKRQEIEMELDDKLKRWEYLHELNEKINNQ